MALRWINAKDHVPTYGEPDHAPASGMRFSSPPAEQATTGQDQSGKASADDRAGNGGRECASNWEVRDPSIRAAAVGDIPLKS